MEQYLGRQLTSDEIIHHINGDASDNRIENLEIMSRACHNACHFTGSKSPNSVLTEEDVTIIRYCLAKGVSGDKLAETFGVTPKLISNIKLKRAWKHVK
jgi:hypothetical protein